MKLPKEITTELDRLGLTHSMEVGKKHLKLWLRVGESNRLVVLSKTASDHRTLKNAIGDIRRIARGMA